MRVILVLAFIVTFFCNIPIYSEFLLLHSAELLRGKLIYMDNEKLIFESNNKNIEIMLNNLRILQVNSIESDAPIIIRILLKNKTQFLHFLRLQNDELFFLYNNRLTSISLKKLSWINFESTTEYNQVEKFKILDFYDVKNFLSFKKRLIEKVGSNKIIKKQMEEKLEIENPSFFEKFWEEIKELIKEETKEKIWKLIEIYSEKEKIITSLFGKDINITVLQNNILNLKKDFYYRAINIITLDYLIY